MHRKVSRLVQVLVVLVEKGGLFAQHKVVYFVIGTRVRSGASVAMQFLLSCTDPVSTRRD